MKTTVGKWGNSLAIRIPSSFAEEIGLSDQSAVDLSLTDNSLVVKPVRGRFSLEDLVSKISRKNRHSEVDLGGPVGREVW
jgi:antitoxin MazE